MKSYFGGRKSTVEFDFSDIRQKALLITSGGKAPGPQPLKEALLKIDGILSGKENGDNQNLLSAMISCAILLMLY